MLSTDDRQQIAEVLALHAHVTDEHELEALDQVFVPDAVYDMSASGMGVFEGVEAIRTAAARMIAGGVIPQAHFLTNVVISDAGDGSATARSRGLVMLRDGSLLPVTHRDELRQHDGRWRISSRVITPLPATSHPAGPR